jgi:hypothetical protein
MAGVCVRGAWTGGQSVGRRTHRPRRIDVGDFRGHDCKRGLRGGTRHGGSAGRGRRAGAARADRSLLADQPAERCRHPRSSAAPCAGARAGPCERVGHGDARHLGCCRSRTCRAAGGVRGAGTGAMGHCCHLCRGGTLHRPNRSAARPAAAAAVVVWPGAGRAGARREPGDTTRTGAVICPLRDLMGHSGRDRSGLRGTTVRCPQGRAGRRAAMGRAGSCRRRRRPGRGTFAYRWARAPRHGNRHAGDRNRDVAARGGVRADRLDIRSHARRGHGGADRCRRPDLAATADRPGGAWPGAVRLHEPEHGRRPAWIGAGRGIGPGRCRERLSAPH